MKFLSSFLFVVLLCLAYNFLYLLFGFSMYFLSKCIHSSRLEQFSVRFIAYGDAPFFGAHRQWIAKHCTSSDCKNCPFWTCVGKEVK